MPASSSPLRGRTFALLGCGALGGALARALAERGATLALWNRTPGRAVALAVALGPATRAASDLARVFDPGPGPEAVFLCVSEPALAGLAETLAAARPGDARRALVALHTAGACAPDVLAALAERGWSVGKLHPLLALPAASARAPALGSGAFWALSGDPAARALGAELVGVLEGRVVPVAEGEASALSYHAAANLVAGGAVALVDLALCAAREAAPAESFRPALAALLASVAANLAELPPEEALTGPQARGATEVVAAHLGALQAAAPEAAAVYRALARRMLALARARGAVDPARLAALERMLADA